MIKYNINTCDQCASEIMVHFTKACENKCPFCVDALNHGVSFNKKPDVNEIFNTLLLYSTKVTDVTLTGGEPFVYINELYELCKLIKEYTKLRLTIISSIPSTCNDNIELFYKIFDMADIFAITPQHYNEIIADKIRGHKSKYNHQFFYQDLIKYAKQHNCIDKIIININVCKPYLCEKEDILTCIKYYNDIGFVNIKLCEMFDRDDMFVNIEKVLGIKSLKSPFAHGCSTKNFNIKPLISTFHGNLTIKRVCFYKTSHRHSTIADWIKLLTRSLFQKKYFFGVIHENGKIYPYWV